MVSQFLDASELKLGPLTFKHQVQKIEIQEVKSVRPIDTVRTNRYFISDSGEARHVAQIRLLFTGLNEINAGIDGGTDDTSGIRGLIALFKTCPVTTIQNKELGTCWSYIDDDFIAELKEQEASALQEKYSSIPDITPGGTFTKDDFFANMGYLNPTLKQSALTEQIKASGNKINRIRNLYSKYIPCSIDSLHVENVPEIPYSLQVTLVVSRTDPTPYFDKRESFGSLLYQSENKGARSPDPFNAFWLKKWMTKLLDGGRIKNLDASDFNYLTLTKYSLDYPDTGVDPKGEEIKIPITTSTEHIKGGILLAESCSLSNKFSYKKLTGHGWCCPTHMGSTSRSLSLDIVFNNQESSEDFELFCKFKESSDKLVKLKELDRLLRVEGWLLKSPVSKLLNTVSLTANNARIGSNHTAFVPVSIDFDTSDIPNMVNCRINLIENNPDIFSQSETIIGSSGSSERELRDYFDAVLTQQQRFKTDHIIKSNSNYLSSDDEPSFRLFWPVGPAGITVRNSITSALLNKDTLRAVLLETYGTDQDDEGEKISLKKILKNNVLSSGKVKGQKATSWLEQVGLTLGTYWSAIAGGIELSTAVTNLVDSAYFSDYSNDTRNRIKALIGPALFGNIEGSPFLNAFNTDTATKEIIRLLLTTSGSLSVKFTDKLFKVITERKPIPSYLSNAYSNTGIYDAFYILLLNFNADSETASLGDISILTNPQATGTQNADKKANLQKKILDIFGEEVNNRNLTFGSESLFPDLILPTYIELYGDKWADFAPTFGDLGQSVPLPEYENLPAVGENNYVSPAAWFFIKRQKGKLREVSKNIKEQVNKAKGRLSVTIPFNTDEIEKLRDYFSEGDNKQLSTDVIRATSDQLEVDPKANKKNKAISQIINNGLKRWRNQNRAAYDATLADLAAAYEKGISPENPPKIYFTHNGNKALLKQSDIPGLGGHIYTALDKLIDLKLNSTEYGQDEDESSSSLFSRDVSFHRNLGKNNDAAVDSSISQVQDDFYSAEKMFPTFKMYLIDKRGDEVVGDSTLFSINAIKSIDITLDKHDSPLAVIKIADPLFILQNDVFSEGNIDSVSDGDKKDRIVRASLPSSQRTRSDFYKRYKLAQGRAIQIRIGYSSVPSGLPIVFTGRITEIQHGDELIIVAQGWKAELFNRQVSFYNDKAKSWGPRDLVIQTITEANPDGIGTNYTPDKTKIIGRAVDSTLASAMVERVQTNQTNSGISGSRSVSQQLGDWLGSFINANESEGLKGLDFRLKNIWYPDTKLYSNIFGLRSFFGIMPTGVNDSWVIPIQPAWYAIEEATRHTWNTVADVVPYDTESTLFMGHPDQPYYYTKGSKYLNRLNGQFNKQFKKDYAEKMEKAISDFIRSDFYKENRSGKIFREARTRSAGTPNPSINDPKETYFININSLLPLKSYKTAESQLAGNTEVALKDPAVYPRYIQAKNKLEVNKLVSFLYRRYFNVSLDYGTVLWPTMEGDLEFALQHNGDLDDVVDERIRGILSDTNAGTKTSDVAKARKVLGDALTFLKGSERARKNSRFTELSALLTLSTIADKAKPVLNDLETNLKIVEKGYNLYGGQGIARLENIRSNIGALRKLIGEGAESFSRGFNREKAREALIQESFLENNIKQALKQLEVLLPIIKGQKINKLNNVYKQWPYFKAFVYFFSDYINSLSTSSSDFNQLQGLLNTKFPAPNMRVFRVHHYLSDDLNIISNKMTATTNEMWNTVVIEHPERGEVDSIVDEANIINTGKINASANWKYWPSQEVTGVKGLQFHPGIILSNKKVKVFTELNCQSQDLAAKLACNRLAEGIRKMYRGNICNIGKHIKPHDRIILADNYSKMSGVVGVESVIHHFNSEDGWVTNIKPEAVCDSNPSASVMQTAALEATYESIFNVIDFASEALTWAAIIATAGAATPLAVGSGSSVIRGGLAGLKGLFRPGKFLGAAAAKHKKNITKSLRFLRQKGDSKGLLNKISGLYSQYGGVVNSYYLNQLGLGVAKVGVDFTFKSHVISGFAEDYSEGGEGVEQLPVIINPVLHNGTPLVAGLELGDHMWQVGAVGTYYSFRSMREALINYAEEIENELEAN